MSKKPLIQFQKLQASGNDFILVDNRARRLSTGILKEFAKRQCRRRFGIGADGFLVIESSKKSSFFMRIFNPDGSEVDMCGNGARCAALWAKETYFSSKRQAGISFETKAGVIEAVITRGKGPSPVQKCVKIRMTDPFDFRLLLPLFVMRKRMKVSYLNTGVPHTVIFVQGLDAIDVQTIGSRVRYHKRFQPDGTNVDFVEYGKNNTVRVRTYERGVEAETLACGTGVVASGIISWFMAHGSWTPGKKTVRVQVKCGDLLRVHFTVFKERIENVWLEGKAMKVYTGSMG